MPRVKLIILILEAVFSLLSSRLGYLEESRYRKRNKSETEREREGEEERRANIVSSVSLYYLLVQKASSSLVST